MEILKSIKKSKNLEIVLTNEIYGGCYAVINWNNDLKNAKTGLCFEAAKDLFRILKKLENH